MVAVVVVMAVVVAVLAGLAYRLGAAVSPGSSSPPADELASSIAATGPAAPPASSAASLPPALGPARPSEDPVATAVAWLQAFRDIAYTDPGPTAWIERVRPVVTDRLALTYDQARAGTVGADWASFVARHCTATVHDGYALVPDEAPRTRTTVSVQVVGTLQTRCASAGGNAVGEDAAPQPDEALAATLTLRLSNNGLWKVDQRLY